MQQLNGTPTKKDFSKKNVLTKNRVKVELKKNAKGKYELIVAVFSTSRKGLKATNIIDPGLADGQDGLRKMVGVSGGACGEHLCANYADNLDPDKCAKVAVEAFDEVISQMAKTGHPSGSYTAIY